MKHQDALDQLARETARAGRRIALERALRAGFWLLLAVGAWAAVALFGGQDRLPLLAQSLAAIGALIIFALLGLRARRAWRAPTTDEARRRLAADSALDNAAFEALEDQPTRYDPFSMALWRRELTRALSLVEKAKAGPPRPRLDEFDRYRLRYVVAMLLIGGVIIAGAQAPDRLARAFIPDPGPLLGDRQMAVEAWLTPAEYTRSAPVSLSERLGESIATPPSVEATVRVTGPTGAPRLVFSGEGGRQQARFTRAADGAWEARLAIPGEGQLKIVRFHTRASWRITPQADAPPMVAFAAPVALAPEEHAVVNWRASDDFGVRALRMRVRPVNPPESLSRADPVDIALEMPTGDPREAEDESSVDVGPHPYAGMEVEAQLVAVDALGQEGLSEPLRFTMPEKVFLQPLARAAIEIRRHILAEGRPYRGENGPRTRLIRDASALYPQQRVALRDYDQRPSLRQAPEGVRRAARLIDALTMLPQDGYFRDLAVYLGLRLARSELAVAERTSDTGLAADTLWRTALRAEYGGAADARRALEEAQRQLAEALQQGAPQERIRQLMEALRRATDNYMQALVQEAQRNGERQNMEDTEDQTELSGQDIEDLLDQVQRLSEQGRTEEAQRLLQMLANILANLDVQLAEAQGGEGENSESEQAMQQSMDQLSEAIGEQRELNSETQQEQQQQQQQQRSQGGSGGDQEGGQGGDDLAERQQEIREAMAQAQGNAEGAGAAPSQSLNEAENAMRRSEEALRRGDFEGAEAAQAAALDQLRQGAEALAAEIRERGREGGQQRGEAGRGERDPLGRDARGGAGDGGDANMPSQFDPVRAREIFDEIRRRAQDANRPETERDYLRRLLDRFGDS